jgi:hypothetical protein
MSPTNWGPPLWVLFHGIVCKIKDDKFSFMGPQFFNIIKQICSNLPCPDCSQHATYFLSRVDFSKIKTKEDFIMLLYTFHNSVNKRNGKPLYSVSQLDSYNNVNLVVACRNFSVAYKTRGNMKLLADNFQRQMIMQNLSKWLLVNYINLNL